MAHQDPSSRAIDGELLPTIAYVVLGMLQTGRSTGYAITSTASRSTRHFFAVSDGQVYPWLKRLVDCGLAEVHTETDRGRTRQVHELTAAGSDELRRWLALDEIPAYELRDEGLLKLFFSDALPVEGQRTLLDLLAERHNQAVRTLEAIRPVPDSPLGQLTLRHGIERHRWERDWYLAVRDSI